MENNYGLVVTWEKRKQLDWFEKFEVTYADSKWQDYHKPESRFFLGILGLAALYSAKKGMNDFWSVVKRTQRVKKHNDALAVEALIQRYLNVTMARVLHLLSIDQLTLVNNPSNRNNKLANLRR